MSVRRRRCPGSATAAASACCSSPCAKPARSTTRSFRCSSACRRTFHMHSTISIARPRARAASGRCGGSTGCSAPSARPTKPFFAPGRRRNFISGYAMPPSSGGKSLASVVLLAEPGSTWLTPVAGTGAFVEEVTRTRVSIDPDHIYGAGLPGWLSEPRNPASTKTFSIRCRESGGRKSDAKQASWPAWRFRSSRPARASACWVSGRQVLGGG